MKELVKSVSHQQVVKLLHNKFVVVLGDSIQRSVYKDLVLLLQSDKYLTTSQLRSKGEWSFLQDCLVEGGSLSPLHNGTDYREVRQYQTDHHLLRFYFVTRVFSSYMKTILSDFRHGPKPDVLIINSCVWDISRYNSEWLEEYKENLHTFFDELNGVLPMETLVIWNVTMPLAEKIRGGFLVEEIEHKSARLRYDVIEANFFGGTLADGYGLDVLDLHFQFRFSLQHRAKDGVHWNAVAHRQISWLLLQHMAQAWGVALPCTPALEIQDEQQENRRRPPVIARIEAPINFHYPADNYLSHWGSIVPKLPPPRSVAYSHEFYSDSIATVSGFMSFERPSHAPPRSHDSWSYLRTIDDRPQLVRKSRNRHHYTPYSYHYTPYSYHRPQPSQQHQGYHYY